MISIQLSPTFPLGQVVATRTLLALATAAELLPFLLLHASGDWGEVSREDGALNDAALEAGDRVLSVYDGPRAVHFWILTEADRSATTLLLPEDY